MRGSLAIVVTFGFVMIQFYQLSSDGLFISTRARAHVRAYVIARPHRDGRIWVLVRSIR